MESIILIPMSVQAYLIKFDEHTPNPYFEGRQFLNPRNEQPKSRYPHWEICEPKIRKNLDTGSILFFAPKGTWNVKCVLKVEENITERRAREKLGNDWAAFYERQACTHPGTSRYGNIIIGSLKESFTLGDGVDAKEYLPRGMLGRKHNNGRMFTDVSRAEELYQRLMDRKVGPLTQHHK